MLDGNFSVLGNAVTHYGPDVVLGEGKPTNGVLTTVCALSGEPALGGSSAFVLGAPAVPTGAQTSCVVIGFNTSQPGTPPACDLSGIWIHYDTHLVARIAQVGRSLTAHYVASMIPQPWQSATGELSASGKALWLAFDAPTSKNVTATVADCSTIAFSDGELWILDKPDGIAFVDFYPQFSEPWASCAPKNGSWPSELAVDGFRVGGSESEPPLVQTCPGPAQVVPSELQQPLANVPVPAGTFPGQHSAAFANSRWGFDGNSLVQVFLEGGLVSQQCLLRVTALDPARAGAVTPMAVYGLWETVFGDPLVYPPSRSHCVWFARTNDGVGQAGDNLTFPAAFYNFTNGDCPTALFGTPEPLASVVYFPLTPPSASATPSVTPSPSATQPPAAAPFAVGLALLTNFTSLPSAAGAALRCDVANIAVPAPPRQVQVLAYGKGDGTIVAVSPDDPMNAADCSAEAGSSSSSALLDASAPLTSLPLHPDATGGGPIVAPSVVFVNATAVVPHSDLSAAMAALLGAAPAAFARVNALLAAEPALLPPGASAGVSGVSAVSAYQVSASATPAPPPPAASPSVGADVTVGLAIATTAGAALLLLALVAAARLWPRLRWGAAGRGRAVSASVQTMEGEEEALRSAPGGGSASASVFGPPADVAAAYRPLAGAAAAVAAAPKVSLNP